MRTCGASCEFSSVLARLEIARLTNVCRRGAVKAPMYTVAVTPILVGSAAAYAELRAGSAPTAAVFLLAAVAIIAWLNLTNDVFDFDTGIDVNKKESIVNLCGGNRAARNSILAVANVFLAAAFAALASLSFTDGLFDATVLVVIAAAVAAGYMYQGPPFRLGYYGLGEPICFVTWVLGVCAAYYAQTRAVTHEVITDSSRAAYLLGDVLWARDRYLGAAAVLVALPTTIILFCSHFHQGDDDRRAGKKSPIVRLGTERASRVLQAALLTLFVLEALFLLDARIPFEPIALSLFAIPAARELASFVRANHSVPERVRTAKYYAVKFHFMHGVGLALGFCINAARSIG